MVRRRGHDRRSRRCSGRRPEGPGALSALKWTPSSGLAPRRSAPLRCRWARPRLLAVGCGRLAVAGGVVCPSQEAARAPKRPPLQVWPQMAGGRDAGQPCGKPPSLRIVELGVGRELRPAPGSDWERRRCLRRGQGGHPSGLLPTALSADVLPLRLVGQAQADPKVAWAEVPKARPTWRRH